MEILELSCIYTEDDNLTFKIDACGEIEVTAISANHQELVFFYKKQKARQLHEWLGRYLENANG